MRHHSRRPFYAPHIGRGGLRFSPMALQVTERISIHDLAVDAPARMYQVEGYQALIRHQPRPRQYGRTPFDLFVPALQRVQEVETAEKLPAAGLSRLRRCRGDGLPV